MTTHRRAIRALVLGLTVAIVATLWSSSGASAQPAMTSASGCPSVVAVFGPGTTETNAAADPETPVGLFAPIAASLDSRFGAQVTSLFVPYPASAFTQGMTYGNSEATGVESAKRLVSDWSGRCPAVKFVLAGYSQGADVIGDLAADIGCKQSPVPAARVLAVGLVADPQQGTNGGKVVGSKPDGTGILGPRASGFCALSAVVAEHCEAADKYCSTNAAANPIQASLGQLLGQPSSTATTATSNTTAAATTDSTSNTAASTDLTSSLVSDFSGVDLTGLPKNVATIADAAKSNNIAGVTAAATSVVDTLSPLGDIAQWASQNPTALQTLTAPNASTADQAAAKVLGAVQTMDVGAAMNAASSVLSAVSGTTSTPSTSTTLSSSAADLSRTTAPLTSTPAEALSSATSVLSILKPQTVIDQVLNVASGTLSFVTNVPSLLDCVPKIFGVVTDAKLDIAGKVRGVHDIFKKLTTLFYPLIKMAAAVDLHMISSLLGMIPDPSGTMAIVSLVVSILGNVDVIGLANQVIQLTENLWTMAEKATESKWLDVGVGFVQMLPTVLGFATTAFNAITGGGTKTSANSLGQTTTTTSSSTSSLAGISNTLSKTLTSKSAADLSDLVREGIDAGTFLASQATKTSPHDAYSKNRVDAAGHTTVQWLTEWFINRIEQVGV